LAAMPIRGKKRKRRRRRGPKERALQRPRLGETRMEQLKPACTQRIYSRRGTKATKRASNFYQTRQQTRLGAEGVPPEIKKKSTGPGRACQEKDRVKRKNLAITSGRARRGQTSKLYTRSSIEDRTSRQTPLRQGEKSDGLEESELFEHAARAMTTQDRDPKGKGGSDFSRKKKEGDSTELERPPILN